MRNLMLIRFDMAPRRDVSQVLSNHMEGKGNLVGMPGVVMTTFATNSAIEDIHNDLQQLDDCFYVLINPSKDNVKVNFPTPLKQALESTINANKPVTKADRIIILQKRLDKAVAEQRFEDAADLRDQINNIK